ESGTWARLATNDQPRMAAKPTTQAIRLRFSRDSTTSRSSTLGFVTSISSARRRHEPEHRLRDLLDLRSAESKREVAALGPIGDEVGEMRACGLARLTGRARGDRAVPVRHVQHLAEARAVLLLEVAAARHVDRVAVARAADGADVEERLRGVVHRETMAEGRV